MVQGRFVLDDSMLKWLQALRPPQAERAATGDAVSGSTKERAAAQKAMCDLYIALACACIKGALSHLNMACTVMGSCEAAPACALLAPGVHVPVQAELLGVLACWHREAPALQLLRASCTHTRQSAMCRVAVHAGTFTVDLQS